MLLAEIKKEIIPLSRLEKLQLIEDISKMLRREDEPDKCFTPGAEYPVFTPYNQEKAASQLQQFLERKKS